MKYKKLTMMALASMSVVVLAAVIRDAPASNEIAATVIDPAPHSTTVGAAEAGGEPLTGMRYNRSIDDIGFSSGTTGLTDVHVLYSMVVGDTGGATVDLSGEIRLDILVGGTVISSSLLTGEFDFLANDAITCAVNCASACGSIFGDGVCAGCDCDYNRSATIPGLTVPAGATVRATLLPLASPEIETDDDVLDVVFGIPLKPCDEDLDGNGAVDFGDLLRVLSKWGPCP